MPFILQSGVVRAYQSDLKRAAQLECDGPFAVASPAGGSLSSLRTDRVRDQPTYESTGQSRGQSTTSNNQHLVAELRRFATFEELRRSKFYHAHETELSSLLKATKIYRANDARPRLQSFLRVVQWNIERGTRLDGIVQVLNSHSVLGFADLMFINELDDGMGRSGNLNIALELSRALSAHAIYGVEYLELTKGVGDEVNREGDNTAALHGNAILTRHSFSNAEVIRLPRCENNFESKERRIGGRIVIMADLEIGGKIFTAGNTHLDVVNTPRCRATQMRAMLQAMEVRMMQTRNQSAIIGGDLNSHTFGRGTRLRAMKNTATILGSKRDSLNSRLSHPETREPSIREFARFGYETEGFNDRSATSRTIVSNLDDASRLPRPMKWWVNRRIGTEGLLLEFRLDWLAARGIRALKAGEVVDEQTGVASIDPQTLLELKHDGLPLSDHDPIVVDLAI
jgi:endonuclease/exonuclease/phosphatase family metal-dependent hydrolase